MCRGLAHALPLRLESNNQAVLSIGHEIKLRPQQVFTPDSCHSCFFS